MSIFEIAAILLSLAALFSYINFRYIKWPTTIGLMFISLVMSLSFIGLSTLGIPLEHYAERVLSNINFHDTLMNGMLSFLLFAGSLHVNINELRLQRVPVTVFATLGLMISVTVTGILTYGVLCLVGSPLSWIYCFVFGALISPTDPVAVLALLKQSDTPKSLQTKIAGESLFNDGVGIVIFVILLEIAIDATGNFSIKHGAILLLEEAGGGAVIGLGLGYLGYRLLKSIDNYQVEVLITLALVAGGYALALRLHASGPIAMVVAGLSIGNHGRAFAMSDTTREHLETFWELVDEILNATLFVLIGMELVIISFKWNFLVAGIFCIPVSLFSRFIGIGIPLKILSHWWTFSPNATKIMTWGGLRGGISVALALSLPSGPEREVILTCTYGVVVFSVIGQGLSFQKFMKVFPPTKLSAS